MEKNSYQYHQLQDEDCDMVTTTASNSYCNITLVWVDEEALNPMSADCRVTIDMLEKICGNNCKLYNRVDLFLTGIESMTNTMKLIVIMSGTFAKTILPKLSVSLLREISSIFIFCKDYHGYKHLLKTCRKVIDICTDDHSLKEAIENDLDPSTDFLIIDRNLKPLFSLQENYQEFLWYKLNIEVLTHYPWSTDDREKMLTECTKYYWKNKVQKKKIEEFKNRYTPEKAIEWYTTDCFLYRLVNKALRSLDMEQINIFRPYIRDLCKQLERLHKQNQSDKSLTVFRGYGNMTTRQLDKIRENAGALVSFNGFLSTSANYEVAVIFAGSLTTDDESVVFEIKMNYDLKNVVFADISQFSNMQDEDEVLFSLCSVFIIDSIVRDMENKLWKIIMSATDEDTLSLPDYINKKITEKHQKTELNLRPEIDVRINDEMDQEINNTIDTTMSVKKKSRLLYCINLYCGCRPIIVLSVIFFFIAAIVLAVIFGVSSKSKDQVSSSYSCESINCTTFSTTTDSTSTLTTEVFNNSTSTLTTEVFNTSLNSGRWLTTGELARPKVFHTTTVLLDGRAITVGGSGTVNNVELYNPVTQIWSPGQLMIDARQSHTATLLPDGRLFVAGGERPWGYIDIDDSLKTAEIYNPVNNSWSSVSSMNTARTAHQAVYLLAPWNQVLIMGGYDINSTFLRSCELYDFATNKWTFTTSMIETRVSFAATYLSSLGKVVAIGGNGYRSAEMFTVSTAEWIRSMNTMANIDFYLTATLIPNIGQLLVVGAQSIPGNTYLFNPVNNSFTFAAIGEHQRLSHTATLLPSGLVVIAGGMSNNMTIYRSAEVYDYRLNTWRPVANMNFPHFRHEAVLLNISNSISPVILVTGGQTDPTTSTHICELFFANII